MPAVTANTLTLPRVGGPGPADTERPVRSITTGPSWLRGRGLPGRARVRGRQHCATLDPFVHMDQMGEVEYRRASPRAPPGIRTAASRPSPT